MFFQQQIIKKLSNFLNESGKNLPAAASVLDPTVNVGFLCMKTVELEEAEYKLCSAFSSKMAEWSFQP